MNQYAILSAVLLLGAGCSASNNTSTDVESDTIDGADMVALFDRTVRPTEERVRVFLPGIEFGAVNSNSWPEGDPAAGTVLRRLSDREALENADFLISGHFYEDLLKLDIEISVLLDDIEVTANSQTQPCPGGGDLTVREELDDISETITYLAFNDCILSDVTLNGTLQRIYNSYQDAERRFERRSFSAGLSLEKSSGQVVSLSSSINLKNTWSEDRICGGRAYDVELRIYTGSSFAEVIRNGDPLRVRNASYGANESILVVPDSAPDSCSSSRVVNFDGAAAVSLEPGTPIWIATRKIGRMAYGEGVEVEGDDPRLSLRADDGSGTTATLINAETKQVEIFRSNDDSGGVIDDEDLFYRFEP